MKLLFQIGDALILVLDDLKVVFDLLLHLSGLALALFNTDRDIFSFLLRNVELLMETPVFSPQLKLIKLKLLNGYLMTLVDLRELVLLLLGVRELSFDTLILFITLLL